MRSKNVDKITSRLNQDEREVFWRLLIATFLEWHSKGVAALQNPNFYVPSHGNYPNLEFAAETGLPRLNSGRFSAFGSSPKRYSSLFPYGGDVPPSLLVPFKKAVAEENSETFATLISWVKENEPLLKYFSLPFEPEHEVQKKLTPEYMIKSTLGEFLAYAIEQSFYREGISAANAATAKRYIAPYAAAILQPYLEYSTITPILGLRFAINHTPISETTYLMKMSPAFHKARTRIRDYSGNTDETTIHLATHAFVTNNHKLANNNLVWTRLKLNLAAENDLEQIDSFFGAIRLVSPVSTGYAQILHLIRKAKIASHADLQALHGTVVRKYPAKLSKLRYSSEKPPSLNNGQIDEVKKLFVAIRVERHNKVKLALRRLNSSLIRDNDDDALLDAVIGFELLLSDNKSEAISYKLRMRAAALSKVSNGAFSARDMKENVIQVYNARSKLVHGSDSVDASKKIEFNVAEPEASKQTMEAQQILRRVAKVLIENSTYLDVTKLDDELMLGIEPTTKAVS